MAVAVGSFETYSGCFDRIQLAHNAIQQGKADRAVNLLSTVQKDAKTLQRHSRICFEGLRRLEVKQQQQLEQVMEEVNQSYQQEKAFEKQERELEVQKKVLAKTKESEEDSYREAERKRRNARDERDKAQEKIDHLKRWCWVPGYGLYLAIEELVEDNTKKIRDSDRDMDYYRNRAREAENQIDKIDSDINEVKDKIREAINMQYTLNEKRNKLHDELGDTKKTSVFLLEATQFWDDLSSLSNHASSKTDRLEKLLSFAAKKNQVKILRSSGTKTVVGSFRECWMEIEDMLKNNDLIFADDSLAEINSLVGEANYGLILAEDDDGVYLVEQSAKITMVSRYFALVLVLMLSSVFVDWWAVFAVPLKFIFYLVYSIFLFVLFLVWKIVTLVLSVLFYVLYLMLSIVISIALPVIIVLAVIGLVLFCIFNVANIKIKRSE